MIQLSLPGTIRGALHGRASWAIGAWNGLPSVFRWLFLMVGAIGIQLMRRPETMLQAEFFQEDGQVFFLGTYFGGPLDAVLRPYAGYLHLAPRLVALLSRLVAVAQAPLVTNTAALLITAAVASYVASGRMAGAIPSAGLRITIAALVVLLPNSHESIGSITHAQWYLGIFLLAAAFATRPRSRLQEAFDLVTLCAASLTGPWGLVLSPLYVWQARSDGVNRVARRPSGWLRNSSHWDGVGVRRALAVGIPSLLQLACIVTNPEPILGSGMVTAPGLFGAFGTRFVDAPFLGAVWTSVLVDAGLPLLLFAGLTLGVGGLVGIAARSLTGPERIVVLYVFAIASLSSLFRVRGILDGFLNPGVAERYVVIPGLILGGVALTALLRGRGAARAAAAVLVAGLTFGIVGDFRIPSHPSLDWPERSRCIGGSAPCTVPVREVEISSIHWPGIAGTYRQ